MSRQRLECGGFSTAVGRVGPDLIKALTAKYDVIKTPFPFQIAEELLKL